ncbi:MAG: hypothetical protein QOE05_1376 [Actinomycetota bacterium]|jgi:hypothetical protein|nr:hypothetical protein [Actinomycetota bacterium]
MTSARLRALLAVPLLASVALGGAAHAGAAKVGPNLAPNPSFEESTQDAATQNGVPVTPVGWAFEGGGPVFDYNQRGGHSGARNVQISGAVGLGRQLCDHSVDGSERCAPNPAYAQTHQVDEQVAPTYSIRPFWVTDAALPVTARKTYRFSVWAIRPSLAPDAGVVGEGAQTRIRWVDAAGNGIGVVDGASLVKGPKRQLGFKLISADLKAPAGAAGAVLMLGHTDYSHSGAAVAFDDVSFQQVG